MSLESKLSFKNITFKSNGGGGVDQCCDHYFRTKFSPIFCAKIVEYLFIFHCCIQIIPIFVKIFSNCRHLNASLLQIGDDDRGEMSLDRTAQQLRVLQPETQCKGMFTRTTKSCHEMRRHATPCDAMRHTDRSDSNLVVRDRATRFNMKITVHVNRP
jgi:hypothetical protein